MKVQQVGSRGYLFTWDEPYKTNVYAINGDKHLFICDTFLGIEPMEEAHEYLRGAGIDKPVVVFISHGDYDHYWGNGAFKNAVILAQEGCWERIHDEHEETYARHTHHKTGRVELVLPNMVFKERVIFPEDGVEFYHTPGHTKDSSSCMDVKDHILFVGDNVESPLPYLYSQDLDGYINSLEGYFERKPKTVISGHDPPMSNLRLVKENLEYVKKVKTGKVDTSKLDERALKVHEQNLKTMEGKHPPN